MRAFSDPAGGVIVYQLFVERGGEYLVANAVLNNSVNVMQCVDFSFLWIMNEERIIPGHLIRLILQ